MCCHSFSNNKIIVFSIIINKKILSSTHNTDFVIKFPFLLITKLSDPLSYLITWSIEAETLNIITLSLYGVYKHI